MTCIQRAKYISQTAQYIVDNESEAWLHGLRKKPYLEAKSELMKLQGVGPKVGFFSLIILHFVCCDNVL